MAIRKKKASSGPNNSYMISFGDTMTALLAFFIVLNSLASEQTGANLYSGTGSFIQATNSLGVPGIFPSGRSQHSIQLNHTSPHYRVADEADGIKTGHGPDEVADRQHVRDREQDDFERMLNELERLHAASTSEDVSGEVTFDRHQPLPKGSPHLDEGLKQLLVELRPFLSRSGSEAEIIVWTPTPSVSAWKRSTQMASEIQTQAVSYLQLNNQMASRLKSSSWQWSSPDLERPVLSVVIRRTGDSR
ncbi:flagellar motor protein MotB [Thalassoglobus sp.]|uniref:flagellar motor protein MotB n=1 Tax=Thalassoglobus sp. TaxID=2795869 RepID=UPI003AA921B5